MVVRVEGVEKENITIRLSNQKVLHKIMICFSTDDTGIVWYRYTHTHTCMYIYTYIYKHTKVHTLFQEM